jgi:hypothetical protein
MECPKCGSEYRCKCGPRSPEAKQAAIRQHVLTTFELTGGVPTDRALAESSEWGPSHHTVGKVVRELQSNGHLPNAPRFGADGRKWPATALWIANRQDYTGRPADDYFATPPHATHALLDRVRYPPQHRLALVDARELAPGGPHCGQPPLTENGGRSAWGIPCQSL